MKLALIQHANQTDRNKNLQHIKTAIEKAASNGAQLILLQELHNHLYFCQTENIDNFALAETIPGTSTDFFGQLARQYQVVIVCSLFEKRAAGLYHNTAVVIEKDGSIAGKYRKMHIPDDPAYYEKYYFAPGDLGFTPIQTSLGKLGVMICWDQWYPEAARLMTLAGADILLYPTAIGEEPSDSEEEKDKQQQAWKIIQQSHAIANGIYVACCNRTGTEKTINSQIDFWGQSFICDPQGKIISEAKKKTNDIIYADIDTHKTEKIRQQWPYLRDRRIEDYKDLSRRFIDT